MAGNPAQPAPGVRLCGLDELEDPGSKGFRFAAGDLQFAGFVVRDGESVAGYVDRCPHGGQPLDVFGRYLTRTGRYILCGAHGGTFKLTGEGVGSPCIGYALRPWPVKVQDGAVMTA